MRYRPPTVGDIPHSPFGTHRRGWSFSGDDWIAEVPLALGGGYRLWVTIFEDLRIASPPARQAGSDKTQRLFGREDDGSQCQCRRRRHHQRQHQHQHLIPIMIRYGESRAQRMPSHIALVEGICDVQLHLLAYSVARSATGARSELAIVNHNRIVPWPGLASVVLRSESES
jgi:hypothetical protein